MAAQDYIAVAQQLYVSYFGRPADYYGLQNYTQQLDALKAPTDFVELTKAIQAGNVNPALTALINSFNSSPEAIALYGNDSTQLGTSKFVNAVYQNVLNRDADLEGLNFWVGEIMAGRLTRANAAAAITEGALSNETEQGLLDKATVENKTTVATNFTAAINTVPEINGYAGDAAAAAARDLLKAVDDETDPAAYQTTVENALAAIVGGSQPSATHTLTDGLDTLTGTSAVDIFNASSDTLSAADTLNGGTGNDVLNYVHTTGANFPSAGITNIETFNVRNASAGAVSADLGTFVGLTTFNSDRSADDVTVTNLAAGAAFGIIGNSVVTNGDSNVGYAAAAEAAVLNVSNGTVGAGAVVITGTGIKSTTINSTGGANAIGTLGVAASSESLAINATTNLTTAAVTAAGVKDITIAGAGNVTTDIAGVTADTLTITGSGNRTLGTLNNATDEVDASAATGKIVATLGNSATIDVTTGSGDDQITAGVALTTGTVNAGAGTDRLVITNSTYLTAATGKQYTGFEVLQAATGVTADLDNIAGITALRAAGTVTFNNVTAAQAAAITATGTATLTVNVKDAATVGQLDTVSVDVVTTNTAATVSVAASDVETINVKASTGTAATTVTLAHDDWSTFNLSGAADATVNSTATAALINSNINASTATGDLTLNFALTTTNGLSITSGAGDDTITGTAQADRIVGGAGDDLIAGGNGADVITGGAGKDIFSFAAAGTPTDGNGVGGDTVTDFVAADDIIRLAGTVDVVANGGTATATSGIAVANGVATFAAADDTLAEKITTLIAATAADQAVIFTQGSDTYVYGSGAAGDGTNDFLIKLTGVTGLTKFVESTTTAGDFTLSA